MGIEYYVHFNQGFFKLTFGKKRSRGKHVIWRTHNCVNYESRQQFADTKVRIDNSAQYAGGYLPDY